MTGKAWDCTHKGHVWLEEDGSVFNRPRDLTKREPIPVHCRYCEATAEQVGWGKRK